jgi:hypothetical protein
MLAHGGKASSADFEARRRKQLGSDRSDAQPRDACSARVHAKAMTMLTTMTCLWHANLLCGLQIVLIANLLVQDQW